MVKKKIILAVSLTLIVLLPFIILKIKNRDFSGIFGPRYQVIEGYISEGDVLGEVLLAQNIPAARVNLITAELKKVFNVRKCKIGDRWEIYLTEEGEFVKFIYYDGPIDFYVVEFNGQENTYLASALAVEAEKMMRGARGEIRSSLYESMTYVSVNPEIIVQFAEIFASKIDFFTDCRTGDEFNILWESYFDKEGNPLKDVRISAASYASSGTTYRAFYFETPDGKGGYYDENGKSVEAVFLRAPLSYRRISSHFTYRRFHPIHRTYRPHLGIDYAAPSGTPVSAIGNGTINFAGRRRDGLGITVIMRHPNGYISWYGHLSKIAKGVSKGSKARKGQVIGYVGSTGVATGPHLDFRIQKGGKFINFLALKMPPSYPLAEEYIPAFKLIEDDLKGRLETLKGGEVIVFSNQEAKKKI